MSDKRLTTMSDLYERLSSWAHGKIDGSQAIRLINKIWAVGEEEGYWSERGQLAADAVWIAVAHSECARCLESLKDFGTNLLCLQHH